MCERVLRREKVKKALLTANFTAFEVERDMLKDPVLMEERAIAAAEEVCVCRLLLAFFGD